MIRHAAGFHDDPCFLVVVSDIKVDLQVQEVGHPVAEVHVGGGAAVPDTCAPLSAPWWAVLAWRTPGM